MGGELSVIHHTSAWGISHYRNNWNSLQEEC